MLLDSYSTSLLLLKTNPLKFMVTLPQGRGSVSYLASHLGLNLGGVKELKNEFGAKKWIWTIPSHLPFGKKMLLKNEFWLCPPTYLFLKKIMVTFDFVISCITTYPLISFHFCSSFVLLQEEISFKFTQKKQWQPNKNFRKCLSREWHGIFYRHRKGPRRSLQWWDLSQMHTRQFPKLIWYWWFSWLYWVQTGEGLFCLVE